MSSHDEILEFLVKKVEETGIGLGITLCVNGLVITGTLMRSQLYYDEMSRFLDNPQEVLTSNQSELELWRRYLEDYKQFIEQMSQKSNNAKGEGNPKFIHLRQVMIYPSSDFPSSDFPHPIVGLYWRGQLSSVDGFFLGNPGTLNFKEPEPKDNEQP
jgi:hypothetical protein